MLRQHPLPYPALFQCIGRYIIPGRRKRGFTDIAVMGSDAICLLTQVTLQAIDSDEEGNESEIDSDIVLQFDLNNPDPLEAPETAEQGAVSPLTAQFPPEGRLSKRPSMCLEQHDDWYIDSNYSDDLEYEVDESFLAASKELALRNELDAAIAVTAASEPVGISNTAGNEPLGARHPNPEPVGTH